MNFGVLESNGGGILEAFQTLLSSIFIPALKRQKDWGTLSEDAKGQQMKTEFLTKLSSFVSVLANAQASISDVVELSALECIDTRNFTTSAQIMGAAGNSELMELVEKTVQQWCAEIEQVGAYVRLCIACLQAPHLHVLAIQYGHSFITTSQLCYRRGGDGLILFVIQLF